MKKFNIHNLVRPNVAGLKPYSSARDEYQSTGSEMVFLDANENPFQTDVNRYPDPQQRNLKAELAKIKNVSTEHILLGNGSDEVLDLLFRAFCEPGTDNVITLPPTYGMYKVLGNINNIENREVLLSSDFEPNVEEILNSVDQNTKMIFLCSPNNPTGNSFSEQKIIHILENFKGLVIIDEAYIDFSTEESWLNKLEKYPNLVITQTLSKAYGMAGIRLGICYASEEIIQILNKIKPPYNVNELTQLRALERVLNKEKVDSEISDLLKERALLSKALVQVNFIEKIYPSDANFILVKVDDANKRYDQLLEKGIVIRNRTTQPLCENTLRFTVGTGEENYKLLEALKHID
ncbi:histidinol-phosphate aminotransferase [Salegentibacter agarivorans]|jgi:histidinol-phosphate aminotransferase|uniref:Histidinol-phosphate aminotransferase n=2 Tax=Salegentibacter TaxID=143222 RepID=A0A1I2K9G0_9FLAO|nr:MULTISPECIES: histidinol-phosphate transaminase [Salegentibacter]APS39532.1 histidinol phosphate aminotransferase [Salegentibacter sp. T436]SFF62928.1 histidinol-phosphate aminotransferase [Salegentibacter agarivorans]